MATTVAETTKQNTLGRIFEETQEQVIKEYEVLRAEMLQRVDARDKIVVFSLALLAAVLAFQSALITLVAYPLLGFFLAVWWAHNDLRIGQIGEYVRKRIEKKLPGLYWEEHFHQEFRGEGVGKPSLWHIFRGPSVASGGILLGTQMLAVAVPLLQQSSEIPPTLIILMGMDVLIIVATFFLLGSRKSLYR